MLISVITVDLFNSLHVRQNHTTCTSVKGLSRLKYTIIPSLTSWKVRVNYIFKFGLFSWKLTCSGSTTLTRAGRPRPRYMQHIAETSWWHLILDKDLKNHQTFLSRGVCSVSMKTKSKTLANWEPPHTAQKGDGDWKNGKIMMLLMLMTMFVKIIWMFVKLRVCLWKYWVSFF